MLTDFHVLYVRVALYRGLTLCMFEFTSSLLTRDSLNKE
jgi:hypothetical protein